MKLAELKQVKQPKTFFPNKAIIEKSINSGSVEVPKEALVNFEAFDAWMLTDTRVK